MADFDSFLLAILSEMGQSQRQKRALAAQMELVEKQEQAERKMEFLRAQLEAEKLRKQQEIQMEFLKRALSDKELRRLQRERAKEDEQLDYDSFVRRELLKHQLHLEEKEKERAQAISPIQQSLTEMIQNETDPSRKLALTLMAGGAGNILPPETVYDIFGVPVPAQKQSLVEMIQDETDPSRKLALTLIAGGAGNILPPEIVYNLFGIPAPVQKPSERQRNPPQTLQQEQVLRLHEWGERFNDLLSKKMEGTATAEELMNYALTMEKHGANVFAQYIKPEEVDLSLKDVKQELRNQGFRSKITPSVVREYMALKRFRATYGDPVSRVIESLQPDEQERLSKLYPELIPSEDSTRKAATAPTAALPPVPTPTPTATVSPILTPTPPPSTKTMPSPSPSPTPSPASAMMRTSPTFAYPLRPPLIESAKASSPNSQIPSVLMIAPVETITTGPNIASSAMPNTPTTLELISALQKRQQRASR